MIGRDREGRIGAYGGISAQQSRATAFSHGSPGLAEVSGSKLDGIGAATVDLEQGGYIKLVVRREPWRCFRRIGAGNSLRPMLHRHLLRLTSEGHTNSWQSPEVMVLQFHERSVLV